MSDAGEARELRRRAEHAETGLRRFADAVSHDLRTPLATIVGYLELLRLREEGLDETSADYLARAEAGAQQLGRMLAGLRVLAQLPIVADHRTVAWRSVLDTALHELPHDVARYAGQVLVADPLPEVAADPELLARLVGELIDNALRHHPEPDSATVAVRAGAGGALVVEDDGDGVGEDQLERVLEPFQHGRTPGPRGGVGLAVAHHIVKLHDGTITLSRGPRGGLHVTVDLSA